MRTDTSKHRSRWIVALLFALTYAWLLWPSEPRRVAQDRSTESERLDRAADAPTTPQHLAATNASAASDEKPTQPTVDRRPLIAKIELDKTEVCPGEDVQASFTTLPSIANPVQYTVPGYAYGNPVIVSYAEPGEQTVHVVANDGVGGIDVQSAQVRVLEPTAIECANRPMVWVSADLSGSEDDTAVIQVRTNLEGSVRYHYELGDGSTRDTTDAQVQHSYALRLQREPTSSYVITVRASGAHGRSAVGRASIALRNTHWLSSVVGSPMVPASFDRFPKHHGTHYATQVTLRNIEERPLQFHKATLTLDSCRDEPEVSAEYPIDKLMNGSMRLEPGQELSAELSLPEDAVQGACRVMVLLEGDTIPPRAGTPIGPNMARTFDTTRAQLALEIAPPPLEGALPAAAPVAVIEPELTDVLERAQALVGPEQPLTPELLAQLHRDGKL